MDFSFVDGYSESTESTPPPAIEAQSEGYKRLVEVAQNIPLLNWNYNNRDVPDTGEKMGIITQSLLKVPGLASMVHVDENGIQNYDSGLLAGAALGLVAELARVVLDIKLRDDYAKDNGSGVFKELSETNPNTGNNSTNLA